LRGDLEGDLDLERPLGDAEREGLRALRAGLRLRLGERLGERLLPPLGLALRLRPRAGARSRDGLRDWEGLWMGGRPSVHSSRTGDRAAQDGQARAEVCLSGGRCTKANKHCQPLTLQPPAKHVSKQTSCWQQGLLSCVGRHAQQKLHLVWGSWQARQAYQQQSG
jgi:hypothetical protein